MKKGKKGQNGLRNLGVCLVICDKDFKKINIRRKKKIEKIINHDEIVSKWYSEDTNIQTVKFFCVILS